MSKGQGFGFGLGKMKELSEAFKKAQQVQEGAKKLQEELEQMEIEGEAGGKRSAKLVGAPGATVSSS